MSRDSSLYQPPPSNWMGGEERLASPRDHGGSYRRTPRPSHQHVRDALVVGAFCTLQQGPNFHGVPQRCSFKLMRPARLGRYTGVSSFAGVREC
jgi:hypothetical protein